MLVSRMTHATRRIHPNWSFIEVLVLLFFFGLALESFLVAFPISGVPIWLLILGNVAAIAGLMWLVAREPANL